MSDVMVVKQELEAEVAPLVAKARAMVVASQDDYDIAMQVGKECKNRVRFVEEGRLNAIKVAQYGAYKLTMDAMKEITKPLEEAMAILKNKAITWQQEENRKREALAREALRKAQEEAEKIRKAQEDEQLKLAEELSRKGFSVEAEMLLNEKVEVVVAPVAEVARVSQIKGTAIAQNWTWEIIDINALPRAFMVPDEKALTMMAKHDKGDAKLPGVRFYDAGSVRFGR
jgi:hypothetical protein